MEVSDSPTLLISDLFILPPARKTLTDVGFMVVGPTLAKKKKNTKTHTHTNTHTRRKEEKGRVFLFERGCSHNLKFGQMSFSGGL